MTAGGGLLLLLDYRPEVQHRCFRAVEVVIYYGSTRYPLRPEAQQSRLRPMESAYYGESAVLYPLRPGAQVDMCYHR